VESRILAERGRISELYQVLLNSPPIAHGWEQMLSAVRNRSSLDAGLRELVILRVAVLNGAPYEFNAHVPHAHKAGKSDAAIEATRSIPCAADAPWTEQEHLAIRLTDAMTRDITVADALFAQVQARFSAQEQVDLVATIAAYNMVSRFLTAFHIGH
jgi:AhpD family alkylhydroperoxidase